VTVRVGDHFRMNLTTDILGKFYELSPTSSFKLDLFKSASSTSFVEYLTSGSKMSPNHGKHKLLSLAQVQPHCLLAHASQETDMEAIQNVHKKVGDV
jgi:hypothetical protein